MLRGLDQLRCVYCIYPFKMCVIPRATVVSTNTIAPPGLINTTFWITIHETNIESLSTDPKQLHAGGFPLGRDITKG